MLWRLTERGRVTKADKKAFAAQVNRLIRKTGKVEAEKTAGMVDLLLKARGRVDDAFRSLPKGAEFSRTFNREIKSEVNRALSLFSQQAVSRLKMDEEDFAKLGLEFTEDTIAAQGFKATRLEVAPELVENAATRSADLIRSLSQRQVARANDIINVGVISGKSVFEVADEMAKTFDKGIAQMETIARTEMLGVHSQVQFAQMSDMAVTEPGLRKQWIAVTDDDRTRPSHLEAHLQVRDWDEPFEVGDDELMFPRDPSGSAGETIACRCFWIQIFPGERVEESAFSPDELPVVRLPLTGYAAERSAARLRLRSRSYA